MEEVNKISLSENPKANATDTLEEGMLLTMERDLEDLEKGVSKQEVPRRISPEKIEQIKRIARERAQMTADLRERQAQEFQQEVKAKIQQEKEKKQEEQLIKQRQAAEEREKEGAIVHQIRQKARRETEELKRQEQAILEKIREEAEKRAEPKRQREQEQKRKQEQEREKQRRIVQQIRQRAKEIQKQKKEAQSEEQRKRHLEREKEKLQQALKVIPKKINSVLEKKNQLKSQKEALLEVVAQIVQKESKIEKAQEKLESEEKSASSSEQRHKLEKQRWQAEARREKIEQEKWEQQKKVRAKQQEIDDINKKLGGLSLKKRKIEREIQKITEGLTFIKLKKQRRAILVQDLPQLKNGQKVIEDKLIDAWKRLEQAKAVLSKTKQKETSIEAEEKRIEAKEKTVQDSSQQKQLERQRWQIAKERKQTEQKRWIQEKKSNKIEKQVEEDYEEYQKVLQKRAALETKLWKINIILKHGLEKGKQIIAEKEGKQAPEQAPPTGLGQEPIEEQRQRTIEEIKKAFGAEPKETKEPREVQTPAEHKEPEQEKEELEKPGPVSPLEEKAKEAIAQIRERARKRELELQRKAEQEQKAKEQEKLHQREAERQKQELLKQQEEQQKERMREERVKEYPEKPESKPEKPLTKEEMFERLTASSPEEEKYRREFLEQVATEKTGKAPSAVQLHAKEQPIVFQPIIKKSSPAQQIIIRVLLGLLGLGLIIGIALGLKVFISGGKEKPLPPSGQPTAPSTIPTTPPMPTTTPTLPTTTLPVASPTSSVSTTTPTTTSPTTTSPTTTPVFKEPVMPSSVFPVDNTKILEISTLTDTNQQIKTFVNKGFENKKFSRFLLRNRQDGQYLTLKQIFEQLGVKAPSALWEETVGEATMFMYGGRYDRFGLVIKIKDYKRVSEIMIGWEKTLEKDTQALFEVLGKQQPALSSTFKNSQYKGVNFRFQTISRQDFGICYSVVDGFLIFTSSFESMEATIDALGIPELEGLNLRQRIGQLFIIGFDGAEVSSETEELLNNFQPGGILLLSRNIDLPDQLKNFIRRLQDISLDNTNLPLLIAVDQEGAPVNRVYFTQFQTSQSQLNTPEQAKQLGVARGKELKEWGINLNLAPLLDGVSSYDFLWERSFQKDAQTIADLAKGLVSGQRQAGLLSAVKHFPGYVGISFNPEEELAEIEQIPSIFQFKAVMEAAPPLVMVANAVYQDIDPQAPCAFSRSCIQFLRKELNFQGPVLVDDLSQGSLLDNFSLPEIVTQPLQAGADMLIFSGWREPATLSLIDFIEEAIDKGQISEIKLNQSVLKVIQLKKFLE